MISGFFGGDKRDRTADLLNAIQALSQLSYTPKSVLSLDCKGYISTCSRECQHIFSVFRVFLKVFFQFLFRGLADAELRLGARDEAADI